MATVTVTATIGATCHYWFQPEVSYASNALNVLDIVQGYSAEVTAQTPVALSFTLDDSCLWDVRISFRGAPPIIFDGLNVSGGGNLFTLLTAQGWVAL